MNTADGVCAMNVTISVYSQKAFREFRLPPVRNTTWTICLRRDCFGLENDFLLHLENRDGAWFFGLPDPYCLEYRDRLADLEQPLQASGYYALYCRRDHTREQEPAAAILVQMTDDSLPGYEKILLGSAALQIGTSEDNGLRYSFACVGREYISRHHAVIEHSGDTLILRDQSSNGTFVNHLRVQGSVVLQFGDQIDLWGLHLIVLGGLLAVRRHPDLTISSTYARGELPEQTVDRQAGGTGYYNRTLRELEPVPDQTFTIDGVPEPQNSREAPLLMLIGPSLTMTIPMMAGSVLAIVGSATNSIYRYTGIVTALLSALIGVTWALVNLQYRRKQRREDEAHRREAYQAYVHKKAVEIGQIYEQCRQAMLHNAPAAQELLAAGMRKQHLWERNPEQNAFLTYRIGLGDQPFPCGIRVPEEHFTLVEDDLPELPRSVRRQYAVMHQVPVCVDLQQNRVVGLVGGPHRSGAKDLMRVLVAQIAAQNCYTDVKMAFLYQEDPGADPTEWAFCHWLPHVWSGNRRRRYLAASRREAGDVLYELTQVLRRRSEESKPGNEDVQMFRPWYFVFIEDRRVLENEPAAKYLLGPQNLGVTTFILADRKDDLPNECEYMIRKEGDRVVARHTWKVIRRPEQAVLDRVEKAELNRFTHVLANVEVNEVETGGEIPNTVTFFDLYGVRSLAEFHAAERWKQSRSDENLRALIGVKAGGQPCYLDVHEKQHGPHGLVAGTTGSGKSETLQTYILSLALNFSPADVGFFLIDYKGGGMAKLFTNLPHVLGEISNLSGGQVQRAMVSIKSENLRRERIFSENGVNSINLYTALYKNGEAKIPVPHLFIIIDEFAELKREQPEFMSELISVAQVGRSLGVHLILATQKPSGTVDPNIWSNSRFHLCLRVQNREDSMDMLHRPDAAYLSQAGRGYLQVGSDEVFELFQSGWSGAVYDETDLDGTQVAARLIGSGGRAELTGSYLKRQKKEKARLRWLEVLLACTDQAAARTRSREASVLIPELYVLFKQQGMDFPVSDYNTRSLEHYFQLLEGCDVSAKTEDKARWLMDTALERGVKLPEMKGKTQLDAVVNYLADVAQEEHCQKLQPLWLPPLPRQMVLAQVQGWAEHSFRDGKWPARGAKWELAVLTGIIDDPANQAQEPMEVNFTAGGHHAIYGTGASGKSTFVQTILFSLVHSYSPEYLNVYIVDFSSRLTMPFADAPQVGGIVFENETEKVGKLFYLLQTIIQERRQLFHGATYMQYVSAHGMKLPAVLVVIDNIAAFREKMGEQYDLLLSRMTRECEACGVYFLVTAGGRGMTQLPRNVAQFFRTSICMEMNDPSDYADLLNVNRVAIVPEKGIPGRGLVRVDEVILEYQTAVCLDADQEYDVCLKDIAAACARMKAAWHGKPARPIPTIPDKLDWDAFLQSQEAAALMKDPRWLPIGYDQKTASIYAVDLSRTFSFVVSGFQRSGKTNLLRLVLRLGRERGAKVFILDAGSGTLGALAKESGAAQYTGAQEISSFVGNVLQPEFLRRNAEKARMIAAGTSTEEIFDRMAAEQPWMVVVPDLGEFFQTVYSAPAKSMKLDKVMEMLCDKGYLHNIYFFSAMNADQRSALTAYPLFQILLREKHGVHLGGNVDKQIVFEFDALSYREKQALPKKVGFGLIPATDEETVRQIVIPKA